MLAQGGIDAALITSASGAKKRAASRHLPCSSRKRFIAQNPFFLLLGIRNVEAARRSNRIQSGLGIPPEMDECTGCRDSGPADASPAMDPDLDTGAEMAG